MLFRSLMTLPTLSGGTPPYTWLWSPTTNLTPGTETNQFATFDGAAAQSYMVQVTDALGFTATAAVNVNVLAVSDTYYYIGGDASLFANWNSQPDGLGLAAPSFGIGGTTFVVIDRKSTRLNSSHLDLSRMPSSA